MGSGRHRQIARVRPASVRGKYGQIDVLPPLRSAGRTCHRRRRGPEERLEPSLNLLAARPWSCRYQAVDDARACGGGVGEVVSTPRPSPNVRHVQSLHNDRGGDGPPDEEPGDEPRVAALQHRAITAWPPGPPGSTIANHPAPPAICRRWRAGSGAPRGALRRGRLMARGSATRTTRRLPRVTAV